MSISTKNIVCSDNCQICGQEHLNIELIPAKLGNYTLSRVGVCLGCLSQMNKSNNHSIENDYESAAELIIQTSKLGR